MSLVLTEEGGPRLLAWMLGASPTVLITVHLLGQPYTPHETSTISALAANEVGGGVGYAPQQLTSPRAGWTFAQITAGGSGQFLTLNWTFTAAVTVYGYYSSDDSLPLSLWAELLGNAYVWAAAAPVFALQLNLQLVNLPGVS
jgi:hypothetical protein